MGFQGRRTMSWRSVTMKAQLRWQAATFAAASSALGEAMISSKDCSLMLPMIHSSEEPLQGETLPQGSMKKKSLRAPQGGRYPGSSPRSRRWMERLK